MEIRKAIDKDIDFVGITSDMTVIDVKDNEKDGKQRYFMGDQITFKPSYLAVARLLNSKFIDVVFKN